MHILFVILQQWLVNILILILILKEKGGGLGFNLLPVVLGSGVCGGYIGDIY